MDQNKIYQGSSLEVLKTFPANSIDCCITSPPYWGLRDYGTATWEGGKDNCNHFMDHISKPSDKSSAGVNNKLYHHPYKEACGKCGATRVDNQLGLEKTPEDFVQKLCDIFDEVKRVLKPTGTLWMNLGDSYAGSGKGQTKDGCADPKNPKTIGMRLPKNVETNLKPKDLVGIPWMVAFELRRRGWYLRQDIIWHKPNPMPESVTDRCTKAHEYIFLMSKSPKYYYDAEAIKTPIKDSSIERLSQDIENQNGSSRVPFKTNGTMKAVGPGRIPRKGIDVRGGNQGTEKGIPAMAINGNGVKGHSGNYDAQGNLIGGGKANKRSVWTVNTQPYSEAHFATFPEELIVDCILAGCPEKGIVMDPFMGAGTTALVSRKKDRNFVGIELNPDYIKIAEKRLSHELGFFK